MESERIDTLARTLGESASRRRLLRLSALPLGGGLAAFLNPNEESAAKKKKHKKKRKKKCAKAGQATSKKRKKCCKGLVKNADGRCGEKCDVCASGCAFDSVQAAIDAAEPGDTIRICAGLYLETITIDLDLTLIGAGEGTNPAGSTILDATGSGDRVMRIDSGTVALQGLRIRGGSTADAGGGIWNRGTLEMTDCTVSGNTALNNGGGGIWNDVTLEMIGCTVSGNTAGSLGGGIGNEPHAALEMTDCTVRGNTALNGGGIFNYNDCTLEMDDCTVTGNTASGAGGGIFNFGTVTLGAGTTVTENAADDGGGILNSGVLGDGTSTCSGGSSVSGNMPNDCVAVQGGSCGGC